MCHYECRKDTIKWGKCGDLCFFFFKLENFFHCCLETSPWKSLKDSKEILRLNSILSVCYWMTKGCENQIGIYRAAWNSFVAFSSINSDCLCIQWPFRGNSKDTVQFVYTKDPIIILSLIFYGYLSKLSFSEQELKTIPLFWIIFSSKDLGASFPALVDECPHWWLIL